jgi:hypothetical protein
MLNSASGHEDIWGSEGIASPFLTSALGGGEYSSRFTLGKGILGTTG